MPYVTLVDVADLEPEEAQADGRVQRSVRSRARIVDALIELVREGELLPTGEQVAARAGVGLRTVFRHFEDMDSLHAEIDARISGLARPLLSNPLRQGSLEQRVDALVQQRATLFEQIAPFKHSGNVQRWRSAFLQEAHTNMVRGLRRTLRAALPEVDGLPAPLQQAAELLTSFEAWDRLRNEQGLGRERAQDAVRSAVLALLSS